MSALEIAAVQLDIAWEDPPANFRRVETLAERAAQSGARLVALPEMFATGFSMDAEKVSRHGDTTREFLADLARRLQIWVLGGYAERPSGSSPRPSNACSLMDPSGHESLRYHKIHPFSLAGEHRHFEGGTSLATAEVEGVRVTPLICYDLRFPEPFRAAAARTDLFVVVANWPDPRINAWSTLLEARAIENQAFVLGVNRVGEADGLAHSGRSALIDPLGRPLATVSGQEAVLRGSVEAEEVARVRERFSFLADR
ncbi:MAG: carbon-nitrogen family hydrolase, partial [Acidobacteria bacterium]|nr:carbon-nitrogen family hydrolase [Acidobacteriota bacterium]